MADCDYPLYLECSAIINNTEVTLAQCLDFKILEPKTLTENLKIAFL